MLRLTDSAGTAPLFTGIAAAVALSGVAVLTVTHAGCDEPGLYQPRNGFTELIGGCVAPDDLPLAPPPLLPPEPKGASPALSP